MAKVTVVFVAQILRRIILPVKVAVPMKNMRAYKKKGSVLNVLA